MHPLNVESSSWSLVQCGEIKRKVSIREYKVCSNPKFWKIFANKIVRIISLYEFYPLGGNGLHETNSVLVALPDKIFSGKDWTYEYIGLYFDELKPL